MQDIKILQAMILLAESLSYSDYYKRFLIEELKNMEKWEQAKQWEEEATA